jgi:urease accessory protein
MNDEPLAVRATLGARRSASQTGALDLRLERVGATTRPARRVAHPPLQLSRVRHDVAGQPGAAALTLVHLGGILAGDRYDIQVALGPHAAATVTTAAATQVYQMPYGEARQDIRLQLGAGSRLAWLPEPLILFAGSRFTQTTKVELAPGALLGLLDVLVPGRLARGEIHQFDRYEARLEVCSPDGRCLVAERAVLEPRRRDPAAVGALGFTPVLGSLYILGDGVDAEYWCSWINQRDDRALAGAILPNRAGLLVRTAEATPSVVQTRLRRLWQCLSNACAGAEPGGIPRLDPLPFK